MGRCLFVTLLLILLTIVMSRAATAEKDTCRFGSVFMEENLCDACWEHHQYPAAHWHKHAYETVGVCHEKHPQMVTGWQPREPEEICWKKLADLRADAGTSKTKELEIIDY